MTKEQLEQSLRERAKELINEIEIPANTEGERVSWPFTIGGDFVFNWLIFNIKSATWEIEYPLQVDGETQDIRIAL